MHPTRQTLPVLSLAASLLLLAIAVTAHAQDPSLIPMYGGLDRQADPVLKGADDALIEGTTKEFGSRQAASRRFTDQGFQYYFRDDLQTAMRRFNQGWLLDPNNPDVFYGFMAILNDQGSYCESLRMGERAFELGLKRDVYTLADAGRVHALCAMLDKAIDDNIKSAYIKRSSEYFTEALKSQEDDQYVYGHWASASYALGDYAGAWRYVNLQKQHGGRPGKQFLKMLKQKMPEPRT